MTRCWRIWHELAFRFALPFTPLFIQELGVRDIAAVGLWSGLIAGVFAISTRPGGGAPRSVS
jgi:hypothetical protein